MQKGATGAAESINKFIEGQEEGARKVAPEKKDFWDSFGASENSPAQPPKKSNVGTAAIRSAGTGSGADQTKKRDEDWGDDW